MVLPVAELTFVWVVQEASYFSSGAEQIRGIYLTEDAAKAPFEDVPWIETDIGEWLFEDVDHNRNIRVTRWVVQV